MLEKARGFEKNRSKHFLEPAIFGKQGLLCGETPSAGPIKADLHSVVGTASAGVISTIVDSHMHSGQAGTLIAGSERP